MYKQHEKIVLASSSPRRKELLMCAGVNFITVISAIPEELAPGETPQQYACRLSLAKANAVAPLHPDHWVLGADTDVTLQGKVLGKPRDQADAVEMLLQISGCWHEVYGSFSLVHHAKKITETHFAVTKVKIAQISRAIAEKYAATKEPLDKAGAYAAQGIGAQFIESIEGSFTNVIGLDLPHVMLRLRALGILT